MSDARWRSGGAPIGGLSEALVALSSANASDAELARLQAALAPQLAAPTRSLPGGVRAGVLRGLGSRVWPWLSIVVIGVVASWMFVSRTPAPVSHAPQPRAVAPQAAASVLPDPSPAELSPAPTAKPASVRSSGKRKALATSQTPDMSLAPEAELAVLQRAQSALNRSASAALELAGEHTRLYPNGLFVEEREMLCIEAELKLGKRHEALTRAHAFSERFGRSTYRARIDRLLASHSALKNQENAAPESTQ